MINLFRAKIEMRDEKPLARERMNLDVATAGATAGSGTQIHLKVAGV